MRSFRLFSLVVAAALGGCVSLHPVAPVVDGPRGVRVLLQAQEGDRFRLEVLNYGPDPIEVDRDRVVLTTARGPRARLPGGSDGVATVEPGGRHALDLRYRLGRVRPGERVALGLTGAVRVGGRPLDLPPLEFVAD